MRKLLPAEKGVRHFFGKRYLWLLDDKGVLGLHKVDDKGDNESKAAVEALFKKQEEQSQ